MENRVTRFIRDNIDKTIRYNPNDDGNLIGLPKPYTVPCIEGKFQEMYYWDTYFTNVGLLQLGNVEQAKNNCENMAYLINKYGFMPNGSRTYYLIRSQPPFFTQMVREVYERTSDKAWLKEMYNAAKDEYQFWQEKRITPSGLNRYYGILDYQGAEYYSALARSAKRLRIPVPGNESDAQNLLECMMSFCESGWDCNSRFGMRAHEYNPIDLNSLLYGMEVNIAYFAQELGDAGGIEFLENARKRQQMLDTLCWNDTLGFYCDYDFVNKTQNNFLSVATFYPLFVKSATARQAETIVQSLPKLENTYGIACCENRDDLMDLQWDYPHGWACLHYIVIKGLQNYGYMDDALRIAEKYCSVVEKNFDTTSNLWEKYNTVTGEVSVTKEYESPTMMGWSAGIYLYCNQLRNT